MILLHVNAIPILDPCRVVIPLVPDVDFWIVSVPAVFSREGHLRVREAIAVVETSLDTKQHVAAALPREREGAQVHGAFVNAVDSPVDFDRTPGPAEIGWVPDSGSD